MPANIEDTRIESEVADGQEKKEPRYRLKPFCHIPFPTALDDGPGEESTAGERSEAEATFS